MPISTWTFQIDVKLPIINFTNLDDGWVEGKLEILVDDNR